MPTSYDITFGNEKLLLGSDRTLWWPRRRILFATDLHAGKTEHMRLHGLAIPAGSLQYDLRLLQIAAERHGAERLIFLGDLFHSEVNAEWEVFAAWCHSQMYAIELVRGNHDRFLSDELLQGAGVVVHKEPYAVAPFMLRHHPQTLLSEEQYVLAGHVHPVFWSYGSAHDRLRLPCFWLQEQQLILPAFGSFTGGYAVNKLPASHIYSCSPDRQTIIHAR